MRTRIHTSYLTACLGVLLFAGPELCTAAEGENAVSPGSAEVARIAGKVYTRDELTSYAALIETTEGRTQGGPDALLTDLALQKTIGDIYTTVTTEEKGEKPGPAALKEMNARTYVKTQFRNALRDNIKVSDDQQKAWYKENVARYTEPEKVHARHLFMGVSADNPESAPERVRTRMTKVKADADKGTSFALLAKEHSEAASAASGGDIGLVTYRMPIGPQNKPMNLVLDDALFKLKAGQVSDVLKTSHGLHLMYAQDHTTTRTPSIDDMKTSGILPGAVANDMLTSRIREAIAEAVEKHKGEITYAASTDGLTTETKAFEMDGQTFTIHDLEQIYGPRFTSAFNMRKDDPEGVKDLLKQVLEDEAFVRAALKSDAGSGSEAKKTLKTLRERAMMQKKVQAIIAQDFAATDEAAREVYEKQKETFRQPLIGGHILIVKPDDTAAPSEKAEALQKARKTAEDARKQIADGKDFLEVVTALAKSDKNVTGGLVAKHIVGSNPEQNSRMFDQVSSRVAEPGTLGEVTEMGNMIIVARLDEKDPGEPVPFERMAPRLKRQVQAENEVKARKTLLDIAAGKGLIKWLPGAAAYGLGNAADEETTSAKKSQ